MTSRPRPCASAIVSGVTPWARITMAAPDVHLAERLDGVDALRVELGDDALVVDDLAQRMGALALGGGDLGVVDGLAHAVAEARALGDEDLFDACHLTFEYGMPLPEDPLSGAAEAARTMAPADFMERVSGCPSHHQIADHGAVTTRPAGVEGEEVAGVERRGGVQGDARVRLEARRALLARRTRRMRPSAGTCRWPRPDRSARRRPRRRAPRCTGGAARRPRWHRSRQPHPRGDRSSRRPGGCRRCPLI